MAFLFFFSLNTGWFCFHLISVQSLYLTIFRIIQALQKLFRAKGLHFSRWCFGSYQNWWNFEGRKIPSDFDPPSKKSLTGNSLIFQHDCNPKHTCSKSIQSWIGLLRIWISSLMKQCGNTRQSTSKEVLWNALQDTWRTIPEDYSKKW